MNQKSITMESLDDGWDLIDYTTFINDVASNHLYWEHQNQSSAIDIDSSLTAANSQLQHKECPRKRGHNDSCSTAGNKACRERLRRTKLNDRFAELSCILEPGRPAKTDKLAILGDAIRVLNQYKIESQEYEEENEKLLEEIRTLKVEKNELREEKIVLKADKERVEKQLKAMTVPPSGYMSAHPGAAYQAGSNKMPVFPSYSLVPLWQYLPSSARDTSRDHELRPPAA